MVATMGEALTPAIRAAAGRGRVQHLFCADGEVDEELPTLSLLEAIGPQRYCRVDATPAVPRGEDPFSRGIAGEMLAAGRRASALGCGQSRGLQT